MNRELALLEKPFLREWIVKILESWWVISVILFCCIIYELSLKNINEEYSKLQILAQELTEKKEAALILNEELKLQFNSQSDPAWIELTLMKGLGLSPEGEKKYFFTHD